MQAPGRTRQELQLLAVREILRAIASALPLDSILSVIANMAIIVAEASASWFMLAEGERLRTVVARGEGAERLLGQECTIEAAEQRLAAAGTRPLALGSPEIDAADPIAGVLAGSGEALVITPVRSGGRLLGLLCTAAWPGAEIDTSFLATIAGQSALAIGDCGLRDSERSWRERLEATFEQMAEAVLVFGGDGRLALMNGSAEELLTYAGVQLGDSVLDLVRKIGLKDATGRRMSLDGSALARALRSERVANLEAVVPVPTGTARHLLVCAVPLQDGGQGTGAVVVGRDVTYIRELEGMRAEFLSMISHELRSPLAAILGFAQLISRQVTSGTPPKDLERRLAVVVEQCRRVNALVDDLLDVSQAESGRLTLDLQPVDLPALVVRTVQSFAALAPEQHITAEIPSPIPAVRADGERVEQVLWNLLSNACKFSAPGTEVVVRLEAEDGQAVVSVTDQGQGIAKEDIGSLFLPFHRVRRAKGKEIKGIGLGLYISRALVEAHRGEMWVHSQLGCGSTFFFSLPFGDR